MLGMQLGLDFKRWKIPSLQFVLAQSSSLYQKKLHGECNKGGIYIWFIQKLSFPHQNQPIFKLKLIESCSGKSGIFVSIFVTTESCGFDHSKTTLLVLSQFARWICLEDKLGKFLFLCLKIRNDSVCAHLQSSLLIEAHILYLVIVVFCLSRAQERWGTKPLMWLQRAVKCASHYVECLETWQAAFPTQALLPPHEDTEILI